MRSGRKFAPRVTDLEGRLVLSPVLAPIPQQIVQEGSLLAVQARATDPGHAVTYSLDSPPEGARIDPATGLILWTPPPRQQVYTFTARATDDTGSASRTFFVFVFDNAPNVQAGSNFALFVGGTLDRTGVFGDTDPDSWTATVDYGDGAGAAPLDLVGHSFRLAHAYDRAGQFTVAVTVVDSQGFQGRGFFRVDVVAPPTTTNPSTATNPPPDTTTHQPAMPVVHPRPHPHRKPHKVHGRR